MNEHEDALAPTQIDGQSALQIDISVEAAQSIAPISDRLSSFVPDHIRHLVVLLPDEINRLNETTSGDLPKTVYKDCENFKRQGEDHNGHIYGYDTDRDGVVDLGVMILTDRDRTKEQIFSNIAGSDQTLPGLTKDLSGSDALWRSAVALHEISHLNVELPLSNNAILDVQTENVSDQFLVYHLNKLGAADVARAFMGARALRSFRDVTENEPVEEHSTGVSVRSDFNDHLPPVELEEGMRALAVPELQACKQIYESLGTARDMIAKRVGEMISDKTGENRLIKIGEEALQGNEALLFETTAQMYRDGAFSGDPVQEQYAYEFLEAARMYAPDQFSVANPDWKFDQPSYITASQNEGTIPHYHPELDPFKN